MYNKNRRFSENMGGRGFAPVNVGDELELKIEAVGEKGDGIAKIKGFVIFVPNTKKDETVKVRINKVLRKVGFGEVIGKAESSSKESEDNSEENYEEQHSEEETPEEDTSEESEEDSETFGEE